MQKARSSQDSCRLPDGLIGVKWLLSEKPCLNHWYRVIQKEKDFWKITKDFYCEDRHITLYKIVEYYNGDLIYSGLPLWQIRQIIRDCTFRKVE